MGDKSRAAVIGGGPAGLMAAEALAEAGIGVDIFEKMPSFGRKLLMAGKSGLNITHAEEEARFLRRYGEDEGRLAAIVGAFGAAAVVAWMTALGQKAHYGPSGRVFPKSMKASPLLRAWMARLRARGAQLHTRHAWQGWDEAGALLFDTPEGVRRVKPGAVILALGGASWRRLGSDGAWAPLLEARGVPLLPFEPSNAGVLVPWSPLIRERFAGAAVKAVRTGVETPAGRASSRAEFVVTERGLESGAIYQLNAALRRVLAEKAEAMLSLDLLPDLPRDAVEARLSRPRRGQSMSNHLRRTVRLSGVKAALLREDAAAEELADPAACAARIKALPLRVTGLAPLDEAISTTGGVPMDALDEALMLRAMPGVFCAGEMLAWDAPTGGYLLTACLATGRHAGRGAASFLKREGQIVETGLARK